ncbi:hypothetical protein HanRHA438_Chr10g0457921 [Helianthus annuus]|nr:hypothetical protein HanRHA438_Chr10g0457921 [Helianthus annuus]
MEVTSESGRLNRWCFVFRQLHDEDGGDNGGCVAAVCGGGRRWQEWWFTARVISVQSAPVKLVAVCVRDMLICFDLGVTSVFHPPNLLRSSTHG